MIFNFYKRVHNCYFLVTQCNLISKHLSDKLQRFAQHLMWLESPHIIFLNANYVQQITRNSLCYTIMFDLQEKAAQCQPAFVITRDYYEPGKTEKVSCLD